jgi:hypothetical protein
VQNHLVIFAQLIGGLGQVPFYLDVSFTRTGQVVRTTNTHLLNFPRRDKLVQLSTRFRSAHSTCRVCIW